MLSQIILDVDLPTDLDPDAPQVIGETKVFANKINWNPNNDLAFHSNAQIIDISKSVFGETNFQEDTIIASNILLTTNSFIDYDIDMRKDYRYTLKIDDKTFDIDGETNLPYKKFVYMTSLSETISNCKANYNFSTNQININWDNIKSFNSKLNETTISYNIWIFSKTNNSNLMKFHSNTNSINIDNLDPALDVEQDTTINFIIQKGEYYIYVTPKFVTTISNDDGTNTFTKDSYSSFFRSGKISIPNTTLKIITESPKNFKISSAYNGKISFSWSKPISTPTITPSQYVLTIENPLIPSDLSESITTINISGNKTSYTFDNTNLSLSSALRPATYNVKLRAVYHSLESEETDTLYFTVPVSKINFDYALVNSNGVRTNNIKNGVAGILLKWEKFSYAACYQITIQQFNKNGNGEGSQIYHVEHPTNELKLKWNFPTKKSRFLVDISYTTNKDYTYTTNNTALGASYLGEEGVNYDKEFTNNTDGVGFNLSRSFVRKI